MSCGVGLRHSSDPMLLWLWRRLVAIAPIRPLAGEPPYASDAALEKAKKKKYDHQGYHFPSSCAPTWVAEGVCLQDDEKAGVENRRQRRKAQGIYCDCHLCMLAGLSPSCSVHLSLSPDSTRSKKS